MLTFRYIEPRLPKKKRPAGRFLRLSGAGRPRSYRGKSDRPINHSSTARAHCRPSRMAQTTSDCPRRMSPAPKTPGTEVW